MQVMLLTPGSNLGWIWAKLSLLWGLNSKSVFFQTNPAAPHPDLAPRLGTDSNWTTVPLPPSSELPPLEETGGQWLALEAKGQRDCLSFINGKVSSSFTPPHWRGLEATQSGATLQRRGRPSLFYPRRRRRLCSPFPESHLTVLTMSLSSTWKTLTVVSLPSSVCCLLTINSCLFQLCAVCWLNEWKAVIRLVGKRKWTKC